MTGLPSTAKGAPRNARAVMASRDPEADDIDFFPTPPWGARAGAELIKRLDPHASSVWEPACGAGHMAHGLRDYFATLRMSDLCLYDGNVVHDFLGDAPPPFEADWIVSNPPFSEAEAFVRRAHRLARRGVAMLMRAAMLEGQGRHALLYQDCPLTVFAPFSERLPMHKGRYCTETTTAAFYAWFIWVKAPGLPRPQGRFEGVSLPAVMPIAPGTRQRLFQRSDWRFSVSDGPRGVDVAGRAPSGDDLTEAKIAVLAELAACGERGSCAMPGTMPGGTLAALSMFGLAEHAKALRGDMGGRRYRVSEAGRELLIDLGRSA